MRLDEKTAVVTGGTAGIGLAIAQRLAAEGAHVYVTGRRKPQLDEAVERIGPAATGVQADTADLADLDRLYERIAADGRRLDVVVANAANGDRARLAETTVEHLALAFDTNVRGTLFTVQKALPLLNDGASVILIGSVAAENGSESFGAYAASKAAIRSFARTWANELKDRAIRVNTISPGAVRTPGLAALVPDPTQVDALFAAMGTNIPLGRVAEAAEVASVALFLASSDSAYMTGGNLYVDGGQKQI